MIVASVVSAKTTAMSASVTRIVQSVHVLMNIEQICAAAVIAATAAIANKVLL